MLPESAVAATTTIEEDRHTLGQRRINLVWESTQAAIALMVTAANIYAALTKIDSQALSNVFFLVVGFYFGRTNHQRIGGVDLGR